MVQATTPGQLGLHATTPGQLGLNSTTPGQLGLNSITPGQLGLSAEQKVLVIFAYVNLIHVPLTLVTNGAVMVIIYQVRALHTSYNYFVFALALADALTSVESVMWALDFHGDRSALKTNFEECVFLSATTPFISMCQLSFLMWVCVDRFLQINFPLWYKVKIGNLTSITIILLTFLIEFALSYGIVSFILPYDKDEPDLVERCNLGNVVELYRKLYFTVRMLVQISLMICLSAQVAYVAVRQAKLRTAKLGKDTKADKHMREKIRSVKIMIILLFLFLLFWLPLLVWAATTETSERNLAYSICYFWIKFNSSINAFVYGLSKQTFSHSFKYLLTHRPCAWKHLNRYLMIRKRTAAMFTETRSYKQIHTTKNDMISSMYSSSQAMTSMRALHVPSSELSPLKKQPSVLINIHKSKGTITKSFLEMFSEKPSESPLHLRLKQSSKLVNQPSVLQQKRYNLSTIPSASFSLTQQLSVQDKTSSH